MKYKEINKFSKSIINSEKAFQRPIESINLSSHQQNSIPVPINLIFSKATKIATLHLLTPNQTKKHSITLASRDCTAQLPPQNRNIFPINAFTPIPSFPMKNPSF